MIIQGKVTVNDRTAAIGESADPEKDIICVDGERIRVEKKYYYMLYKPANYVVSMADEYGRRTVMSLVRSPVRVFPVGRLDRDTEGLLLFTNDGKLANCLTHPSFEVEKEYIATLKSDLKKEDVDKLRKGFVIDRRKLLVKNLLLLDRNKIKLSIHEGRKHIVKRLFWRLGYQVCRLVRTRVGPLVLHGISSGHFRQLSQQEVADLKRLCQ